jgi:RNA polymerase sigma-70 factor (ECF subfamily)
MVLGREAASNNAESFDFVFSVHRDYVYGLTHALLGNTQDAEDVTQDVFLRVYKALHTYRPERASMRTWLTKMAVNACNTHRRRTILRGFWQQNANDDNNPALERIDSSILAAPEDHAMRAEVRKAVRDAITALRPEHRTVLVLHYYMDFSCPEIAAVLECPEGTVYSRLHYARRVIQSKLERHSFHSNREA